jgi:hypothetical protein
MPGELHVSRREWQCQAVLLRQRDNPSMVWVQKQHYFDKNKDKISEYRRRKYAENKEAKKISF